MKKYGTVVLSFFTAMAVAFTAFSIPAAAKTKKVTTLSETAASKTKAKKVTTLSETTASKTKTKKVKALSETAAEAESKAEYPSLSEISKANKIYKNLKKGTYTSVLMTRTSGNYRAESMVSKSSDGGLQVIASGASVRQVQKGNLEYRCSEKGIVSIYAAQPVTSGSISCPYEVFSNESVTAVTETKKTYRISTSADISKMTETEQKDIVGTDEGIIEKELVIDKDTLLLKKYTYTIFFDSSNKEFKHVSKTKFSYNIDPASEIPENIAKVIQAEKTRTVTVISAPGTDREEKQAYTVPDTIPLYIRTSEKLYQDAACTEEFGGAEKNQDGVYPSYTIYIK